MGRKKKTEKKRTSKNPSGSHLPRSGLVQHGGNLRGWRVFCESKKPDDRRQVDRLVIVNPAWKIRYDKCPTPEHATIHLFKTNVKKVPLFFIHFELMSSIVEEIIHILKHIKKTSRTSDPERSLEPRYVGGFSILAGINEIRFIKYSKAALILVESLSTQSKIPQDLASSRY